MSAWDAMTDKKATPKVALSSGGDRYQKYLYPELNEVKPTSADNWYRLQYTDLPSNNATDFTPQNNTGNYKAPIIEFGLPKRLRVFLVDRTDGLQPEIEATTGKLHLEPAVAMAVSFIADQMPNPGVEGHVAVFAFDSQLTQVLDFQKIPTDKAALKSQITDGYGKAIASRPLSKERHIYGAVDTILSEGAGEAFNVQRYMNKEGIILADIYVITPGVDNSGASFQAAVDKCRELFIPVNIQTLWVQKGEELKQLSQLTGGSFTLRTGGEAKGGLRTPVYPYQVKTYEYDPRAYVIVQPTSFPMTPTKVIRPLGFGEAQHINWRDPANVTTKTAPEALLLDDDGDYGIGGFFDDDLSKDAISIKPLALSSEHEPRGGGVNALGTYPDYPNVTIRFDADRSLKKIVFQLMVTERDGVDLTNFQVIQPNGALHPDSNLVRNHYKHLFINPWEYFYYYGLEIDLSEMSENARDGQWSIKFDNNSTGGSLPGHIIVYDFVITGESENVNTVLDHYVNVENAQGQTVNMAESISTAGARSAGGTAIITAAVTRGGANYNGVEIDTKIYKPSGGNVMGTLKDDGVYPDVMANDGIFTGMANLTEEGMYLLRSTASNRSGKAQANKLYSYRDEWSLDDESPFLGEKIGENFSRIYSDSFIVINNPSIAREPAPPLQPMFKVDVGKAIRGPRVIMAGIPVEFDVDYYTSDSVFDSYLEWKAGSLNSAYPIEIELTPVPEKGPNVVQLLVKEEKEGNWSATPEISVSFRVPRALEGILNPAKQSMRLEYYEPYFEGDIFENAKKMMMFVGDEKRYDGYFWMPEEYGYDASQGWRVNGPDSVAELLRQDESGCVVKAKAPGTFTLQLASTAYPHIASKPVEIKVIYKEQPGGPQQPGDGDGEGSGPDGGPGSGENDDGDDDVDRETGDGETPGDGGGTGDGGSGGGGGTGGDGGSKPETPDPEDPDILPPGILKISVDGGKVSEADLFVGQTAQLRFEFTSPVERHGLSVVLETEDQQAKGTDTDSGFATISGETLTGDGMAYSAEFLSQVAGPHRIHYRFEGKSGFAASGDFRILVKALDMGAQPETKADSGGGGCNAGPLAVLLLAAIAASLRGRFGKKRAVGGRVLFIALVSALLIAATAHADTYVVTNATDDADFPELGSIRSILNTVQLLGTTGHTVQFAPSIEEIALKAPLQTDAELNFDGYTGRSGKRVVFTLAAGGYRHFEIENKFSFNGIILRGFGDATGDRGIVNGGLHHRLGYGFYSRSTIQNCVFEQIHGSASPILVDIGSFFLSQESKSTCTTDESEVVIRNSIIQDNYSDGKGGAIGTEGRILVWDSFLAANHAGGSGGACDGPMEIGMGLPAVHNTFVGNKVQMRGARSASGTPTETGTHSIVRPTAEVDHRETVILRYCRLLGNESASHGGAVYAGKSLSLCNTTVYGNSAVASNPAVNGSDEIESVYRASLFAANDSDAGNPSPANPEVDEHGNLFADGADDAFLAAVFESIPFTPELIGGYVPVIPLRYAGPAEGKVSASMRNAIAGYPLDFSRDARGVPRDYTEGASVGAFGFGAVTLEPGNIQNSTTIALPPNDNGSIKVKLVERVNAADFSYVNYLGEVSVDFTRTQGDSIENLPRTTETQDNGRAAVTVATGESGENLVRAAVTARPHKKLDLKILIGKQGEGNPGDGGGNYVPETPDDMYVVLLTPERTTPGIENSFDVLFSRACTASTVSVRRKGTAEYVERNIPVRMTGSTTGVLGKNVTFEKRGTYMFDFKMADPQGRSYEDIKPVKVEDTTSLKVFKLSEPPYFEDKTFAILAAYSRAPREIVMCVKDEDGNVYRPDMRNTNERCDWEGLITLARTGYYWVELEYVDGGDGKTYSERFSIYIAPYYGEGGAVVETGEGGGSGCMTGAIPLVLLCLVMSPRLWRRR